MPPPGGSKEFVKAAPFGTKPAAPSDFSHLKDVSSRSFAHDLSKSTPDPRKQVVKKLKKKYEDDATPTADGNKEKEEAAAPPAKKSTSKIDPDDLARFLEAEGGGDASDMCSMPRCMDVVQQIIMNDKISKVEKAMIQQEIEGMISLVKESEKEEERIQLVAESQSKEQAMLENQVENQAEKARDIEVKREEIEREKRGFASQQALLEKDQRQWVTKYRTAQAALAKAIWLKPGQSCDDDDEISIFDGSITSIKSTTKQDEEAINQPSQLKYDKLSSITRVSDFNERAVNLPTFCAYVQDQIDIDAFNSCNKDSASNKINNHRSKGSTAIATGANANQTDGSSIGMNTVHTFESRYKSSVSPSPVNASNMSFKGNNSDNSNNSNHLHAAKGVLEGTTFSDMSTVMSQSGLSYRKNALEMSKSVRSFLETGASKNLNRSKKLSLTTASSSSSSLVSLSASNNFQNGFAVDSSSSNNNLGGSIHNASSYSHHVSDDHSISSMSTLGNHSVSHGGNSSSSSSSGNGNPGGGMSRIVHRGSGGNNVRGSRLSSNKSNKTTSNHKPHLEVIKKVLPKLTGKVRINTDGVGTLNKKNKTIKELLAAEEALE